MPPTCSALPLPAPPRPPTHIIMAPLNPRAISSTISTPPMMPSHMLALRIFIWLTSEWKTNEHVNTQGAM